MAPKFCEDEPNCTLFPNADFKKAAVLNDYSEVKFKIETWSPEVGQQSGQGQVHRLEEGWLHWRLNLSGKIHVFRSHWDNGSMWSRHQDGSWRALSLRARKKPHPTFAYSLAVDHAWSTAAIAWQELFAQLGGKRILKEPLMFGREGIAGLLKSKILIH